MSDQDCTSLLQWALPRLGKRWQGFRNVRGQVCKRLARRARELELDDLAAYRGYLEAHPEEWAVLDELSRVTISRFYRDREVFEQLRRKILPELADLAAARGDSTLRVWSAGCASGEEPYSLAIVWQLELAAQYPELGLQILATDLDEEVLARAQRACYDAASLRDLPEGWRERAFREEGGRWTVREDVRAAVELRRGDIRRDFPECPLDLVLCRNLAFTYFDEAGQRELACAVAARLVTGGVLVLGSHEALPAGVPGLVAIGERLPAYRRS